MTKLEPCPFCGGENIGYKACGLVSFTVIGEHAAPVPAQFVVACFDCEAGFPPFASRVEAITAWNTRALHTIPHGIDGIDHAS